MYGEEDNGTVGSDTTGQKRALIAAVSLFDSIFVCVIDLLIFLFFLDPWMVL